MTDRGLGCKVVRLGLRAPYAHGASKAHLLQEYGLDEWALVRTAEAELGRDLGITENEVLAAPVDAKASLVSAESL